MTDLSHLRYRGLADKVMSAEEAAALIEPGSNVGMSGFTGAGYPKAVPTALASRITEASARRTFPGRCLDGSLHRSRT